MASRKRICSRPGCGRVVPKERIDSATLNGRREAKILYCSIRPCRIRMRWQKDEQGNKAKPILWNGVK